MLQYIRLRHSEKAVFPLSLYQLIESPDVIDGIQPLFIECGLGALIGKDVPASNFILHGGNLFYELPVMDQKGERLPDITIDEGAPDKYFRGLARIDGPV